MARTGGPPGHVARGSSGLGLGHPGGYPASTVTSAWCTQPAGSISAVGPCHEEQGHMAYDHTWQMRHEAWLGD